MNETEDQLREENIILRMANIELSSLIAKAKHEKLQVELAALREKRKPAECQQS